MNKEIEKTIIEALKNNDFDYIFDNFKTNFIYYHDINDYKEIWKKEFNTDKTHILNYYWFNLYKYIGEFDKEHYLFIYGKMGDTKELKIMEKELKSKMFIDAYNEC
jgi:hypothetical protein